MLYQLPPVYVDGSTQARVEYREESYCVCLMIQKIVRLYTAASRMSEYSSLYVCEV
jgi:hypothetical protein